MRGHHIRTVLALFAFLAACGEQRAEPVDARAASGVLGIEVSAIDAPGARIAQSCAGESLVLPPGGHVRVAVARGLHTLRGVHSICEAEPEGPITFRIEGRGPNGEPVRLLSSTLGAAELAVRRAYPFTLTFMAPEPMQIELAVEGTDASADSAFARLRLRSRVLPGGAGLRELDPSLGAPEYHPPDTRGARSRARPLAEVSEGAYRLSDWGWAASRNGHGPIEIGRANGGVDADDGAPLRVHGEAFEQGIGVHAPATLWVHLELRCTRFRARVGVDESAPGGTAILRVYGDHDLIFESHELDSRQHAMRMDLDVSGRDWMRIVVDPSSDGDGEDAFDFLDPVLVCDPP